MYLLYFSLLWHCGNYATHLYLTQLVFFKQKSSRFAKHLTVFHQNVFYVLLNDQCKRSINILHLHHVLLASANVCISSFPAAFSCCSLSFCSEVAQVRALLSASGVLITVCGRVCLVLDVNRTLLPHNRAVFSSQEMKRTRTSSRTSRRWHRMTQTSSTATEQISAGVSHHNNLLITAVWDFLQTGLSFII